uniref:Uncharacterized protein n=1 Tax=Pundamilia nyererei TaxID=303518 RepID=A0A3B4GG48_9CICH
MAEQLKLRVIVADDDFRRLDVPSGIDFRIQFMEPDFNNEFMNIIASLSKQYPACSLDSSASPESIQRNSSLSSSSSNSDSTIILPQSDSELRSCAWPREFTIPRFSFNVEVQLQRGNETFRETGTRLKIAPGVKSDILETLAEAIFQFTAYPQNYQIDEVAGALIKTCPCLREPSATGYYGWMISLKYKMASYRTKMRNIGCPEVTINALKNKSSDDCLPAKNVKKPKKVNFCPAGETDDSLENIRVELLTGVRRRNSASDVRQKMSRTFSYRRQEVVLGSSKLGGLHFSRLMRDLKKHTMGIYVINKEDGQNGHYDDIFVEGEIVMDNIGSPAQACALMLGVIYALNLAYPKELRHYYEFIQKVLMGLDGEKLSPKVLGLKNKIATG